VTLQQRKVKGKVIAIYVMKVYGEWR